VRSERRLRVLVSAALVSGALLACSPAPAPEAEAPPRPPSERFRKEVHAIAMRDGVKLNTEVYVPVEGDGPWPILLNRTPYGLRHDDDGFHTALSDSYAELAEDGYIFVFQDIRGRYGSEGEFVMLRPPRDPADPAAVDEGTDTWDTLDWLLAHLDEDNGKAGLLGISYGGWLTVMGMLEPHPALAAASPQASPADMFVGDDFLHNGAFRLAPSFGYVAMMETGNENAPFPFDQHDVYEWYLELGPLANVDRLYFDGEKPTWTAFMENPTYTEYWQRQAVLPYLEDPKVPALHVAGWWDAEDLYGPLRIYHRLEERDESEESFLVVGPWPHGGWARSDGASLGAIPFGSPTAVTFREDIQSDFFAHYLKGDSTSPWTDAEAIVFETGANQWRRYDQWPPAGTGTRALYLVSEYGLAFEPPSERDGADAFLSDPDKPVPYMPRPIPGFWQGGQALWKVTDQRFVDGRPDVLSYRTGPLESDVALAGGVVAKLFASTTGTDADWVVKLIDVYPEDHDAPELRGFQLMIADEVLRARFRNGFETAEPVPPGEVVEYTIDLGERHHRFLAGHEIMVQIQSTWFPLIDRNPQTFVEPVKATERDYRPATHRVHRSREHPTRLELRVLAATE
jgi:uncharacterized protein